MVDAHSFFEEMMSPFTLKPILDYTFHCNFGLNTQLGAEFLNLMIFNLFITEPHDAIQDVLECNFGFQVTNIAGMQVEQKDESPEDNKENPDNKEKK